MASATRKTIEKTVTEDVMLLELTQEEVDVVKGALINFQTSPTQASILAALNTPGETDDRPIQVGDKVRITDVGEDNDGDFMGTVGIVRRIDNGDPRLPYEIEDVTDGYYLTWAKSVERVND